MTGHPPLHHHHKGDYNPECKRCQLEADAPNLLAENKRLQGELNSEQCDSQFERERAQKAESKNKLLREALEKTKKEAEKSKKYGIRGMATHAAAHAKNSIDLADRALSNTGPQMAKALRNLLDTLYDEFSMHDLPSTVNDAAMSARAALKDGGV